MKEKIDTGMREATRLTRAGQLQEAVAIIQRALQGGPGPESAAEDPRKAADRDFKRGLRVFEEPGKYAKEPQRRFLVGPAASGIHREADPGPANRERMIPPPFAAGLRKQWRELRRPTPWSEPVPDRTPSEIVPDGGRFISGSYTNHAGTRSYKLYVPGSYDGRPLPLVVMLHGCTQNPDDFAAGTRMNALAEEHRCFVAYPAQSSAANGSKCWNWFEKADQRRDDGEPSIIAGITRQIMDTYRIDERRVYVAGMSAGGAMAMTMAMTYPDLYAAVGIHSGLAYAIAQDLPSALGAMHGGPGVSLGLHQGVSLGLHTAGAPDSRPCITLVPAIVFHGDQDTTVHPCNGDKVIAQCATSHAGPETWPEDGSAPRASVEQGNVPLGHAYTRTTYRDASGQPVVEHWLVHGAGHAWSGGSSRGSYTDPKGPDASQEMLRFFYEHPKSLVS